MWNLSSRVHSLNHFPKNEVTCYVKRDDELGCGISGSKLRKYSSLVPSLREYGIRHLIIIAGPQSNNLLAALQIARELDLKVTAFLIQPWSMDIKGNYKLSRLFLDEKNIVWVSREEWRQVDELATQYVNQLKEPAFILSEGANVPEALPGAISLADDIIKNEKELDLIFDHIFVDAGTGFSATGLISGLSKHHHPSKIHVLLLAEDECSFRKKLNQWTGQDFVDVDCFYPETAKSFGAVNQTIKAEIRRVAKEEGILVDPVYSAKLFHESRHYIEKNELKGNVLLIHSGGILTLSGFDL